MAPARALLPFAAFAACALIWGSTWAVIKVGYAEVGAFTAASLRFWVAAAVLLALVPILGARWPRGREWGLAVLVGVLLFGLDYGLIYWGEQFIASGLTAVLFAVMPLTTALAAHVLLRSEPLHGAKLLGIALGIGGVALLFFDALRDAASAPLLPMLAIVGSAVAASLSTVATKRYGADLHPASLTGVAALIGAVALAGAALVTGEGYVVPSSWSAWWPILYLALAGSVVTFLLYFWLLKRWSATNASFIPVFTPLVALGIGAAVLGEPVTLPVVAGTATIVTGVWLANRPAARAKQATATAKVDTAGSALPQRRGDEG